MMLIINTVAPTASVSGLDSGLAAGGLSASGGLSDNAAAVSLFCGVDTQLLSGCKLCGCFTSRKPAA